MLVMVVLKPGEQRAERREQARGEGAEAELERSLRPAAASLRIEFATGHWVVTEAPLIEPFELDAECWLWQVKSMDEALEWVKRHPGVRSEQFQVEVHPVHDADQFGAGPGVKTGQVERRPRTTVANKLRRLFGRRSDRMASRIPRCIRTRLAGC